MTVTRPQGDSDLDIAFILPLACYEIDFRLPVDRSASTGDRAFLNDNISAVMGIMDARKMQKNLLRNIYQ